MTDEQAAKAAKLRKGGLTYKEISNTIGEPRSTIYYTLNPNAVNRRREYREERKETLNEKARKHYKENIEESRAYLRNYYITHLSYYENYRNTHLAHHENYRNTHKEQIRNNQHEHLAERAAQGAKRRALIAGTIDNATPEQLEEIVELYRKARKDPKVRCYICGKLIPIGEREVDHIIPVSKGGSSLPSNLAVACKQCNRKKHAKMPEEIGLLI